MALSYKSSSSEGFLWVPALLWRELWNLSGWKKPSIAVLVPTPKAQKGAEVNVHTPAATYLPSARLRCEQNFWNTLFRCLNWLKVTYWGEQQPKICPLQSWFSQSFNKASLNGSVTSVLVNCWGIQGPMEQLDIAVYLILMEFGFMERLHRNGTSTWDLLTLHLRLQRRDPKRSCGWGSHNIFFHCLIIANVSDFFWAIKCICNYFYSHGAWRV